MDKLYPYRQQLAQVLQCPMVKSCRLLHNQQRRSRGLPDTQRNPMDKLYPYRQQLAQVLQCPMVKSCQLLQVKKLLHSHLGPTRLVQLLRVMQSLQVTPQCKAQLQLVLRRTTALLQDRLQRLLFFHINSFSARDHIPSRQLVTILRLHNSFPRAFYTDHRRRRLLLKAIFSDLPAFLPTFLKFFTKMVALARNLPTQA